jgi:hypothetical protein
MAFDQKAILLPKNAIFATNAIFWQQAICCAKKVIFIQYRTSSSSDVYEKFSQKYPYSKSSTVSLIGGC